MVRPFALSCIAAMLSIACIAGLSGCSQQSNEPSDSNDTAQSTPVQETPVTDNGTPQTQKPSADRTDQAQKTIAIRPEVFVSSSMKAQMLQQLVHAGITVQEGAQGMLILTLTQREAQQANEQAVQAAQEALKKLADKRELSAVTSIEANDDFTIITVITRSKDAFEQSTDLEVISQPVMSLALLAQAYAGVTPEKQSVTIDVIADGQREPFTSAYPLEEWRKRR